MNKILIGFLLFLLAAATYAQGCTTLVYTGPPLTVSEAQGPYPLWTTRITGTVILASALPVNTSSTVTPTAWDFSTEAAGLDSADFVADSALPYAAAPTFQFTTDQSGNIIAWSVFIDFNDNGSPVQNGVGAWMSTQYGDAVTKVAYGTPAGGASSLNAQNAATGTWGCLAPLVNPLAAPLAAAQAQVTTLTSQVATATAQRIASDAFSTYILGDYNVDQRLFKTECSVPPAALAKARWVLK